MKSGFYHQEENNSVKSSQTSIFYAKKMEMVDFSRLRKTDSEKFLIAKSSVEMRSIFKRRYKISNAVITPIF